MTDNSKLIPLQMEVVSENKETSEKCSKKKKIIIGISICIIIIIALVLILCLVVFKDRDNNIVKYEYGIMIDAGSSKTKVYVYNFPKRIDKSLPKISEKSKTEYLKVTSLLETKNYSSFFEEIFNDGKVKISSLSNNEAIIKESPIFLKATAGVRSQTKEKQDELMSNINETFKAKSPFLYEPGWAKIITGIEEGYFGWVSVNYLQGILKENDDAKKMVKKTYGSLDMGGSSVEISFIPEDETISENKIIVNLGHLNYTLFSNSLSNAGNNAAYENFLRYLLPKLNDDKTKTTIEHPCLLKGYSEEKMIDNVNYTFNGTGNYDECEEKISEAFFKLKDIIFPSTKNIKFLAMSGFAYTAKFYELSSEKFSSPNQLVNPTREFCGKNYADVKDKSTDKYLNEYCFNGVYYYYLLVSVFKFDKDEENILFSLDLKGFTPSWTLGAMAYEVGLLPFK